MKNGYENKSDRKLLSVYATNMGLAQMTKEDVEQLDLLNVAFGYVVNGIVTLERLTNLKRIFQFRQWNHSLKIYLSIAGDSGEEFSRAVSTQGKMDQLVQSMMEAIREWGFDGLDIDWEYPSSEERSRHTLLLQRLREELDSLQADRTCGLSIAAGSKSWYFQITELAESVKYLDYVNLMTYDINANCLTTMHHSCPEKMMTDIVEEGSTEENIEVFLQRGVPPHKLIIGAAFYSRQWQHVEMYNHGLHSYAGEVSDYGPGYTDLVDHYVNKNGYIEYWDDQAKAPYLFNGNNFITYENEKSLACKCQLVHKWNIAGIMVWEYSYDKRHELISVMRKALEKNTSSL